MPCNVPVIPSLVECVQLIAALKIESFNPPLGVEVIWEFQDWSFKSSKLHKVI